MAVVLAVFSYAEHLRLDENANEALEYLGAIEKLTGLEAMRRTLSWVRIETSGEPGFLLTIDGGWANSDRMHFIIHDYINTDEFALTSAERLNECLTKAMAIVRPTESLDENSNVYLMSRNGREDRVNMVYEWAADVGKVRDWIIENHRGTFSIAAQPFK